ncbi:anti-sigma factor [Pseudonocardia sp. TRM90224]|uniref:anti-sigma factor n=1 Tax=Pseudonocardia sp. TRM90224 TaxID=2812678 RepID=UPI001E37B05F|nr:zf-HC2 domain-containing protein [Pseudonocardia sp. TRM90224]
MTAAGHDGVEIGAYTLGLLDAQQARAVEQHMAGCAPCRREWEELREMTDLLGELPPEAFLDGPPDGDLVLQRTLRQVRAEKAAPQRRRRWVVGLSAAAVVAAVLGGGIVVGRVTSTTSSVTQVAGSVNVEGTDQSGHVAMRATVSPAANWVRLTANVRGIPAGERCRIIVVAKDGTQEIAGSWTVPATGEANGVTLNGSAAIPIGEVAAVTVENAAGKEFISLST